jgi:hypothetical protein
MYNNNHTGLSITPDARISGPKIANISKVIRQQKAMNSLRKS